MKLKAKTFILSCLLLTSTAYSSTEYGLEIDPDGIDRLNDELNYVKITSEQEDRLDRYFLRLRKNVNKIFETISSIENSDEKEDRLNELDQICKTISEAIESGSYKNKLPEKKKDQPATPPCLSFLQIFASSN